MDGWDVATPTVYTVRQTGLYLMVFEATSNGPAVAASVTTAIRRNGVETDVSFGQITSPVGLATTSRAVALTQFVAGDAVTFYLARGAQAQTFAAGYIWASATRIGA